MLLSSLPARLRSAFANSGNKSAIPMTGSDPRRASYEKGFPPLTMTPLAAGGNPPYGKDFNGVLYELSLALLWQQLMGIRPFDASVATDQGGYPAGAFVTHGGALWRNATDANITTPPGTGWVKQSLEGGTTGQVLRKISAADGDFAWGSPDTVATATEVVAGILKISTTEKALAMMDDASIVTPKKLGQVLEGLNKFLPVYATGKALPASNIGPIWHDDYDSVMTWQAFTANGASYTGYASQLVGNLLADTQPTPRKGYVRSGDDALSRTQYAALRAWGMHHGLMVAPSTWAAGSLAFKDNPDGLTFTVFDVRGEFPRFWDRGRGVDVGRQAGAWQGASIEVPRDGWGVGYWGPGTILQGRLLVGSGRREINETLESVGEAAGNREATGGRNHPRNVALNPLIKF